MRIGIDARELGGRPTGVGRYLRGLLHAWRDAAEARRHEFVLYAPDLLDVALDHHRFPTRVVRGGRGTWWEQVTLPAAARRDHLDVLFAPAYTAPIATAAAVAVTIHDVSFLAHPEWFGIRDGLRRRWLTRQSARRARAILTVSDFSKRELLEWIDVPAERVHVVPNGITPPLGVDPPPARRATVLYVGSIFNRRHVPDLIRAFAPVARAHPEVTLELVGDNRSHPREDLAAAISREGLDGRVRWREYVDEATLAAVYATARVFAFLSEYEGFGLPPLEALAAGVPAVLGDTPAAREVCGAAALYVSPRDHEAIRRALELLLFDEAARQQALEEAPAVLARYSWERAARETLAVLTAAARP